MWWLVVRIDISRVQDAEGKWKAVKEVWLQAPELNIIETSFHDTVQNQGSK